VYKILPRYTGVECEIVSRGNAAQEHTAASLRGGGKRLMLLCCDEAYFFAPGSWSVIWPLVANGAAAVLTSSMAMKESAISELKDARFNDGSLIPNVLDYRATCDECARREKATGDEVRCSHIIAPPMHFRTRTDTERLRKLLEPFGAFDREILNIPPSASARRLFDTVRSIMFSLLLVLLVILCGALALWQSHRVGTGLDRDIARIGSASRGQRGAL
jgi:hypothetical protein